MPRRHMLLGGGVFLALFAGLLSTASAIDFRGQLALQWRGFAQSAADPRQADAAWSVAVQPEWSYLTEDRRHQFVFVPFARIDERDSARSHSDIRELSWSYAARDFEFRAGIRKLFWGVTESRHLVDIINQTDLVESPDGEEKLGQPMLNLALIRDWGTLDLFLLPGSRERSFPGAVGRLRSALPVDTRLTQYQHGAGENHLDWAARWSHYLGDWEFGLSHFSGTARDPGFIQTLNAGGQPVLAPVYAGIDQTGLDVQAIIDDWLVKLELAYRTGDGEPFTAAVGGFEYTLVGVAETDIDVGLIGEYLFDDRHDAAPQPFTNDLMLGARVALNDAQSSELLVGVIQDLDSDARSWSLEASRRIGESLKLSLEARVFPDVPATDPGFGFAKDDYLEAELAWYF